jgi:hypothetical protein
METIILTIMIVGLLLIFTIDTYQKRRRYLKENH